MTDSLTSTTQPVAAHAPTPTPMLESDARNWAMLVHVFAVAGMILSGGLLSFVAPLVIWLLHRQRSALVDFHGRQNLNLQITLLAIGIPAVVLGAATLGVGFLVTFPLWGAYWVYAMLVSIIAGVKAQSGEYYQMRFIIPFVR